MSNESRENLHLTKCWNLDTWKNISNAKGSYGLSSCFVSWIITGLKVLHGAGIGDNTKSHLEKAFQSSNTMWMKTVETLDVILLSLKQIAKLLQGRGNRSQLSDRLLNTEPYLKVCNFFNTQSSRQFVIYNLFNLHNIRIVSTFWKYSNYRGISDPPEKVG